jgi:hypothetical protein
MTRKKSLKAKLTRLSRPKVKTDKTVYQMLRGIEAKIEYHPFLEDWGNTYQSLSQGRERTPVKPLRS